MRKELVVLDNYAKLKDINHFLAENYRKSVKQNKPALPFDLKKIKLTNKKNSCYDKNHKPKGNLGKMIGVEIECYLPRAAFVSKDSYDYADLEDYDFCIKVAKLFDIFNMKGVSVTEDSSLYGSSTTFGVEIQVLFPIHTPEPLMKVLEILNTFKATVDKDCGLHVHVDLRNKINLKDRKKVIPKVEKTLGILGSLVAPYRCDGEYSSIYNSSFSSSKDSALYYNEYLKTLEYRVHQGVLDYNQIISWVNLCYQITHCKQLEKAMAPTSLGELFEYLNLDNKNKNVLKKKYSQTRADRLIRKLMKHKEEDDIK